MLDNALLLSEFTNVTNSVFEWREAPVGDFAVIGSPIHHSLSPRMHQAAFDALGLSAGYHAIHVPIGEVAQALDHLASLGYRGVNVTVPHKEAAYEWAKSHTEIAADLRVCNTLELEIGKGHNTDVVGIQSCLEHLGVTHGKALVLGAGGSARAAVYALSRAGLEVALWNRTQARAEELATSLSEPVYVMPSPDLAGFDIAVNTTSVSLVGESLPLDWAQAKPGLVVFDLAYAEGLTPLLADAVSHGYGVLDGRRMLMEQGAAAFEIWWQQPAPRDAMLEAIS
ncbi:MAG TPA: shikimate dehydrogenase [Fimbriimonas sp.]|nr:shikimate dehydrogenase [Fimbriimonas sp.]